MTKRFLQNTTKWVWCLAALYLGLLSPVQTVNVRHPPKNPTTIEAQAKFFQYRHLPTSEDFDQGHRLGSDRHFTERHERSRPSQGLYSAKVRWGDKKGGYGEHYWDLNHAGPSNNDHGYDSSDDGSYHPSNSDDGTYHPDTNSDDGSYKDDENSDTFDEPSEPSPSYVNGDYDPETAAKYDNGRAKRAHTRNYEKKTIERDQSKPERQIHRKIKTTETVQETDKKKPAKRRQRQKVEREYEDYQPTEQSQYQNNFNDDKTTTTEKSRFLVNLNEEVTKTPRPEAPYVPYENGAGVRQHYQPETSASVLAPRLFLEASTGHIVDRATGRSYLLQPVLPPTYN